MVGSHPRLPIPPQTHNSMPTRTNRRESSCANVKEPVMANGKTTANPNQHARFLETARALGCDEDEDAFKAKMAVIARQKSKNDLEPPRDSEEREP